METPHGPAHGHTSSPRGAPQTTKRYFPKRLKRLCFHATSRESDSRATGFRAFWNHRSVFFLRQHLRKTQMPPTGVQAEAAFVGHLRKTLRTRRGDSEGLGQAGMCFRPCEKPVPADASRSAELSALFTLVYRGFSRRANGGYYRCPDLVRGLASERHCPLFPVSWKSIEVRWP